MPNTGRISPNSLLHGRYIILQVVGRGGMGSVYQAKDTQEEHLVAIKEMSYQGLTTPEEIKNAQELFRKEAEMLAGLSHANLPRVYDYFYEQDRPYLVMDFIEGETLKQRCERRSEKRLPIGEVLGYGIQLCEVLAYLHQRRHPIVFRDLKPSNVMITPNGQLYLIDFGIARLFKPDQTTDTELFVSRGFSAPELIGQGRSEPRSDLYSLGATLHYCLTGQTNELYQLFSEIRLLNQQISFLINDHIKSLTAREPRHRPGNASTAMNTLLQVQRSLSNSADLHDEHNPYVDPGAMTERVTLDWRLQLRTGMRSLWKWVMILSVFLIGVGREGWKWFLVVCQWMYQMGGNAVTWLIAANQRRPLGQQRPFANRPGQRWVGGGNIGNLLVQRRLAQSVMIAVQSYVSLPFALVPLLTAASCICMLSFFHLQPNVVLLFVSIILLFLAFGTSLIQHNVDQTRYILVAISIGTVVTCGVLLLQPDIQSMLAVLPVSQLLILSLPVLIILSLLRPADSFMWIDHFLMILIVAICGYNDLLLFIQMVQTSVYDLKNVSVVAVLSLILLISLFRLQRPFETLDRILVLLLVAVYVVGASWKMYEYTQNPLYNPTIDIIGIIILCLLTIMTLRVPASLSRIGSVPLLVLASFIFLSMYFPYSAQQSLLPAIPDNMVNPNQLIVFGSILLALLLFWSLFLHRPPAQLVIPAIFGTAILCIMLQVLALNNVGTSLACSQPISIPTILLTTFDRTIMVILGGAIGMAFLLSLISTFVHLFSTNPWSDKRIETVDHIMHFLQHLMVLSSITACVLVQWSFGCNELFPMDIGGWDGKLALLAIMFVVKLLTFHIGRPLNKGDYFIMCIAALTCALFFWSSGSTMSPLTLLSAKITAPFNSTLTLLAGYGIAIVASFPWLKNVPNRIDPRVLRIIFGCALFCMLLQLFWYSLLIVVPIMLIQSILLVVGLQPKGVRW